jgi:hypothetical protein
MADREGVYRLDETRWIGFDRGTGDVHTEAEVELMPDGTMFVHDIRQYPKAAQPE